MTTYTIPVSNGIFAHRKKIGAAIWVFLWLVDKTTKEEQTVDGNSVEGFVLGGRPVSIATVATDLALSINGVRDQLTHLQRQGYIRAIYSGAGIANGYAVLHSKKWTKHRSKSDSHPPEKVEGGSTGKVEGSTGKVEGGSTGKVEGVHRKSRGGPPENCGGSTGKLPQHNRKDITDNTEQPTTTTGVAGLSLFGDEFLTPEQAKARAELAALSTVWNYYLQHTGKIEKIYEFSETRRDKGLLRLRECAHKVSGDYDKAAKMMCAAIDGLVSSDWHMGQNPRGKRYLDWDRNLFKSYQQMETWWNQ